MEKPFSIRLANSEDAADILKVYAPFVTESVVSFEYIVPSLEEFGTRLQTVSSEYPWLVGLNGDEIVGYAYGSKHRHRTAYGWSVETTIYLRADTHGKGLASVLYQALFECLRELGYYTAFAGITLPNEKSRLFHSKMGFQAIGTFKNIGYKFGKWHDTHWMQLDLAPHVLEPKPPIRMDELGNQAAIDAIIGQANRNLGLRK